MPPGVVPHDGPPHHPLYVYLPRRHVPDRGPSRRTLWGLLNPQRPVKDIHPETAVVPLGGSVSVWEVGGVRVRVSVRLGVVAEWALE